MTYGHTKNYAPILISMQTQMVISVSLIVESCRIMKQDLKVTLVRFFLIAKLNFLINFNRKILRIYYIY